MRLASLLALALLCSCVGAGKYVWVDDLPEPPPAPALDGYVLAPGDLIAVRVYNQEGMSTRGRVRSDGRISLPFLNDVKVAGFTPTLLAQQLQTRLKEYVNLPVVTVSLEEARMLTISVLGDVPKQGVLSVEAGTRLSQVLAMAGGLTDFAHRDRIFVVRQVPSQEPMRIRFTFHNIARAEGRAGRFVLQNGDVVVVE